MVRASSRLLLLLNNPKSHLQRRPFATFRVARHHPPSFSLANTTLNAATNHLLHISRTNSLTPIKFSQNFSSRATDNIWQDYNHISTNDYQASLSHPWPEWSRFLESLSIAGYFNWISNIEDEFVANQNLSMEFVAAANSCIAFARDRPDILGLLPRKDIEVLIDDGYPFLFKSAHNTERIMRSFLQAEGSNEARSVDLMKYILSYASSPIIYPERNIKEAIESSVRSLLQEMVNLSCRGQSSEQYQATVRVEQSPRYLGPNITMKKGDWICPKCNFMNFARNTKCLECEELRPADNSRYTTTIERGQNDRNAPSPVTMATNSGYVMGRQGQGIDKEEKVASWFKKVKELHKATDPNTSVTHLDNKKTETPFSPKRQHPMNQESSSSFVPFVPFPPDYFAKKDNNTLDKNIVQETETRTGNLDSRSSIGQQSLYNGDTNTVPSGNQSTRPETLNVRSVGTGKSLEGSAVTESDPLDMSEEAKAERWFRRVAQIKDISELSQIPDEDFPSIMPMRKGVNRFVVSKRKTPLERRLTSPEYRKNLRVMNSERKREGDDDN